MQFTKRKSGICNKYTSYLLEGIFRGQAHNWQSSAVPLVASP